MPKLPVVKPRVVIKKLKKRGFVVDHVSGSHFILYKEGSPFPVTVPMHNRDLKPGTISSILDQAGVTVEEFLRIK